MPKIIDDIVYFLERQNDGKYHIEGEHGLTDLGNTIPGFGDRVTLTVHDVGISITEVVGRHFVRHYDEASDSEWIAWFIIVQSVDLQEADDLFDVINENYSQFVKSAPPKCKRAQRIEAGLAHDERSDFQWWQEQDTQRQKYRPLHKLDKPQMRALRFLADHPKCMTVDLIPQCGEKTMEALAKAGCVRSGGKDHRGFREWFVTEEGREEIRRDDTYTNWLFQ